MLAASERIQCGERTRVRRPFGLRDEGGRLLTLNPLGTAIENALSVHAGRRAFIETITGSYVHFLPGVLEEIRANPGRQNPVNLLEVGIFKTTGPNTVVLIKASFKVSHLQ